MTPALALSTVIISTDRPPDRIFALLGESNPVMTDGYGGWTIINRPKRRSMTQWTGAQPFRQTLDLMFDGFKSDTSVDSKCVRLEAMAVSPEVYQPPPLVTIEGPALTHTELKYVIDSLEWGATERHPATQDRVRQQVMVNLIEYISPDIAVDNPHVKPGAPRYRIYTTRPGDTLPKIAAKLLGDHTRWREIARLNNIRDGSKLPVNKKLRVPWQ